MSFNVIDMFKDQITPDNINAVSSLLGENSSLVSKALAGAGPALLSGLIGGLSKPEGKKAFEQQLEAADDSLIGNFASVLGGGGSSSLISTGTKMLGSLFGANKLGFMASSLAKFSGLGEGASKALLGVATPMVMSMLKKKSKESGLGVSGLISGLLGQKDTVDRAIPAGLSLFEQPAPQTRPAAQPSPAAPVRQEAAKSSSPLKRLLPLIALLLLGWLAYQFFLKPSPEPTRTAGPAVSAAVSELGPLLGRAVDTLSSINSVESAQQALPQLQSIDQMLSGIVSSASGLSAAQSKMLVDTVNRLLPDLRNAASSAASIPGVSNVIGSTVDSIMSKLGNLAG
jgi:hypothetical protein